MVSGDVAAQRLGRAGVPGTIVACIDALHEGPTPAGLSSDGWRIVRARFAAAAGWMAFRDVMARLTEIDRALDAAPDHDEIVIWVEHDLLCQLALVWLLDRLAFIDRRRTALSLVCIDRFPGIERFRGLGQLEPAALASLFPTRAAVSPETVALGCDAWTAFCATDPRRIDAIAKAGTPALPFLAPALRRHLEQFPDVGHGLARTERQCLAAVAHGAMGPRQVFADVDRQEEVPFMGDTIFWSYLDRLGHARQPLVSLADDAVSMTAAGREVLDGAKDSIELNGIDRWLGGVHLEAPTRRPGLWRWDERAGGVRAA